MEVGASASFLVSASIELKTESEKKAAQSFSSKRASSTVFNIGGQFSQDKEEWIKTLKEEPMPVTYQLIGIADLLTHTYMPSCNAGALEAAQSGLKKALDNYCSKHIKGKFEGVTCSELADDPPAPLTRKLMADTPGNNWNNLKPGQLWSYQHEQPTRECPAGHFVTGLARRHVTTEHLGTTQMTISCSDGSNFELVTAGDDTINVGHFQEEWDFSAENCTEGFSSIRADISRVGSDGGKFGTCWPVYRLGFRCQGSSIDHVGLEHRTLRGSASPYFTGALIECPQEMPVIVGIQAGTADGDSQDENRHCGLYGLKPKCGNINPSNAPKSSAMVML